MCGKPATSSAGRQRDRSPALRGGAFLAGVTASAFAFQTFRVPATPAPPARQATFIVLPSGELGLAPGPFLTLSDGRHPQANGTVNVRNQTGRTLAVRVRAVPTTPDLDDAVSLVVASGGRTLLDGRLADARSWSTGAFLLPPGAAAPVDVTASLAARAAADAQDVVEDVAVSFDAVPSES